jgi:hypothetical protein
MTKNEMLKIAFEKSKDIKRNKHAMTTLGPLMFGSTLGAVAGHAMTKKTKGAILGSLIGGSLLGGTGEYLRREQIKKSQEFRKNNPQAIYY